MNPTSSAPSPSLPTAQDAIATIEKLRGTRVLVFAPNEDSYGISPASYESVTAAVATLDRKTKIDIIVHSLGGFPGAAYKTARLLQQFDSGFTAMIPRRAKSAATLLCLGANKILMTDAAELGPIDTQMPHPHEPDERISALEGMKGLEAVSGFCHRFLHETMLLVLGQTGRGVKASLELATDFAAPVVRPLFEQIDPMDLGKYKRALEIGQYYAERLLRSGGGYTDEKAKAIAEQLVNGYPQHEFVIDLTEAEQLDLKVHKIDEIIGTLALMVVAQLPAGHHVGFLEGGTPIANLIPSVQTPPSPTAPATAGATPDGSIGTLPSSDGMVSPPKAQHTDGDASDLAIPSHSPSAAQA